MAARISGETEEEIRKDAAALAEIFKAENRKDLPRFSGEPHITKEDEKNAALKELLKNLNNKE